MPTSLRSRHQVLKCHSFWIRLLEIHVPQTLTAGFVTVQVASAASFPPFFLVPLGSPDAGAIAAPPHRLGLISGMSISGLLGWDRRGDSREHSGEIWPGPPLATEATLTCDPIGFIWPPCSLFLFLSHVARIGFNWVVQEICLRHDHRTAANEVRNSICRCRWLHVL